MSDSPTVFQGDEEQRLARDQSLRGSQPPVQVPGFQAERFLGAGAYGEVWLAVDRNTKRRVAIKFYAHRGGLDWSLLSREVEKLTFLFADRRFVQLLGVGWDADPPYYIMEFLEHGSLEDRLHDGPLSVAEALPLFSEIALGLVHAHAKGVLHCDLKPANVLLGADGKPRLADFGQSRLSHEQAPALGTLFYMAPEQADLKALPTAGWDVYALGAVLYRMLVGEPPHRSDDTVRQIEAIPALDERLAAYRRAIRQSKLPTSHRQVAGVDAALAEIIDRCLEPTPERRLPNVQSVLDALARRQERRARRPLLLLGALGPALLLAVMTVFAWTSYAAAIAGSRHSVLSRASESNCFAAEFVAQTAAHEIERRFHALEHVAGNREFRRMTLAATGKGALDDADRIRIQDRLRSLVGELHLEDAIWFLNDAAGMQLARIPDDQLSSIGKRFAYRDYFHGQGRDLPEATIDIAPIEHPYVSIVFEGKSSLRRQVAFAIPVYHADHPLPDQVASGAASDEAGDNTKPQIIGVLSLAVKLGDFAEFKSEAQSSTGLTAMLADLRQDEHGQQGPILEHPELMRRMQRITRVEDIPRVYLEPEDLQWMQSQVDLELKARAARLAQLGTLAGALSVEADLASQNQEVQRLTNELAQHRTRDDYHDPFAAKDQGRSLAAIQPVISEDERGNLRSSHWVVLVEQPYDEVLRPVRELGDKLVRKGLTALGIILAVLTLLWGFVITLVSESSQNRWLIWLRRRLGLATAWSGDAATARSSGLSGGRRTPRDSAQTPVSGTNPPGNTDSSSSSSGNS